LRSEREQDRRDALDKSELMQKAAKNPRGRYLMTGVARTLIDTPDDLSNARAGIRGVEGSDKTGWSYEDREMARYAMSAADRFNLASHDPNIVKQNMQKIASN
jgi:hypothetical protein